MGNGFYMDKYDKISPMNKKIILTFAGVSFLHALYANIAGSLSDYADPFIGTSANGHNYPGATVPFGMIQASPDSGNYSWDYCGGYQYEDNVVYGFSQTHFSGGGCTDLGDMLLLPFVGELGEYPVKVDKSAEVAKPGYYATTLAASRIRVETTVQGRSAIYRITAPAGGVVNLLVDMQWGVIAHPKYYKPEEYVLQMSYSPCDDRSGFTATRRTKSWTERDVAFSVKFNRAYVSLKELPKRHESEKGKRLVFTFDLGGEKELLLKLALSRNTIEAAQRNLESEIPGWDFDLVRSKAKNDWEEIFRRAEIEGSEEQKKIWYTALYHHHLQPHLVSDVGAKKFYTTFGTWDTFRAAAPLMTIIDAERFDDFIESMREQGRITGYLPQFSLWGYETQCMIGTHSVPIIADWFLKRRHELSKSDLTYWNSTFDQIKETLTVKHKGRRRENWDVYDKYGYYPYDIIKRSSVSRTMEAAYDDWCAAQMAKSLGRKDDAELFAERAERWRNVVDFSSGFARGKNKNGEWREKFSPVKLAGDFCEGNSWQYTFHVMQDVPALIEMAGSREKFVEKLDTLFSLEASAEEMGEVLDVTGLIGQYAHGNEPSHHIIYLYTMAGRRDKTAKLAKRICETLYRATPDGICGNEDGGQMSAWYIFSAMGFYPVNPCGGEYVLGAPQVPKTTLRLPNGKTFTVIAKNPGGEVKADDKVFLNGKELKEMKISHADILAGGELIFE